VHRGKRDKGQLPSRRRGRGGNPFDSSNFGSYDRHMCRGHQRVATTRDVGTGRRNRDVALAQEHSWQRLDLEVRDRIALVLSKLPNLLLHEANVIKHRLWQGPHDVVERWHVEEKGFRAPSVELFRVLPDRLITPVTDILNDLVD
jgi:hypothetical protein